MSAVDGDEPLRTADSAALLSEVALPRYPQGRVVFLFVKGHIGNVAKVSLSVPAEVLVEVLAVIGSVHVGERWSDG